MFSSYFWRKLHVLGKCRFVDGTKADWAIDVGYCIDRYWLEPK